MDKSFSPRYFQVKQSMWKRERENIRILASTEKGPLPNVLCFHRFQLPLPQPSLKVFMSKLQILDVSVSLSVENALVIVSTESLHVAGDGILLTNFPIFTPENEVTILVQLD